MKKATLAHAGSTAIPEPCTCSGSPMALVTSSLM
ncbi:hypothetical protein QTP70_003192 [Hemibagrus guttatus]|uniref:Uncharacterized protein n=1 Tax=Hemibagrus guttatus TaxID=175788 RepID=A0AAE0Q2B2_9TELE|nr:hypothetical protein QTP70_003192 [Hemibagrus guttatus]